MPLVFMCKYILLGIYTLNIRMGFGHRWRALASPERKNKSFNPKALSSHLKFFFPTNILY